MLLRAEVELLQELVRLALAARDLVKVLFHLRGEVGLDEVAEVVAQQLRHRERREAGHQRFALADDVAAADNRRNRRRVRRRSADPQALELLDERGFRESRRRRRFVLLRLDTEQPNRVVWRAFGGVNLIADLALGQDGFLLFELRSRIVAAFDIGSAESGKLDGLATGR